MAFSGALTLTDLNDFITPSQACIKPVEQIRTEEDQKNDAATASTEIRIDANGSYYEVSDPSISVGNGTGRRLEQAQVSLNDCLACSGCITSAESVLITLQSHTEVLNFLESNASAASNSTRKTPVISMAPQTLASLAASISFHSSTPVTPRQILRRLRVFCKDVLGFDFVFDTTFARHMALKEHVQEFLERKERHRQRQPGCDPASDPPQLPMIASACPGWICYAEKTHAEMLPFISSTKSPQQVMGTLVKEWMGSRWGKTPRDIYHVTVMPCYDKKLEASRSDFYNEIYATRDVDCVITTGELERLVKDKAYDLTAPVPEELDPPMPLPLGTSPTITDYTLPELLHHPGTASGSYLYSIISHFREKDSAPLELSVKQIRNADYEEFVLRRRGEGVTPGEVIFKGAKCYGFRNLQNVVRKVGKESGVRVGSGAAGRLSGKAVGIKRGRKAADDGSGDDKGYDYIEVMACPGGCINGGGQLKPPSKDVDEEGFSRDWGENGVIAQGERSMEVKWGNREWNKKVEEAYWHGLPTPPATPTLTNGDEKEAAGEIKDLGHVSGSWEQVKMANRLLIDITDELGRRNPNALRTQYHAVESEVIGLAVKW